MGSQLNLVRLKRFAARKLRQVIRASYSFTLTPLSGLDGRILECLRSEGVYVTNLESLALSGTADLLADADRVRQSCPFQSSASRSAGKPNQFFVSRATCEDIAREAPGLFTWGLQPRLLALAERVVGLPPAVNEVDLRIDAPIDPTIQDGSRRWHCDGEDLWQLKIAVYLTDVTPGTPAFEYVPRHEFSGPVKGVHSSEHFERVVPRARWKTCFGPRGTVLFVYSSHTLHHGYWPESGKTVRYAFWYGYTSRNPSGNRAYPGFTRTGLDILMSRLSPEHRRYFPDLSQRGC